MKRKVIEINEELCNGCGLCAQACHEGAIEMVGGKAKLVSDLYCDGLGNCLPNCPTGAITIIERDTVPFDEEAVRARMEQQKTQSQAHVQAHAHEGCPGSAARTMERPSARPQRAESLPVPAAEVPSELGQWPVQIKLVNVQAPYFENADLLIAADCTAYAYAAFHSDMMRGRVTLIGCPKLDDNQYYMEKLTQILKLNTIHSIRVVRMEVPCCGGIVAAVKQAMLNSGVIVPYEEVVVSIDGRLN